MFGKLFQIECRQTLKSLVYYIYVILFVLFITGQMSEINVEKSLKEPEPGLEYYGVTYSSDEQVIMGRTLAKLSEETYGGAFATYPMGFYKSVTVNEKERETLMGLLEDCTGRSWSQIMEELEKYWEKMNQPDEETAQAAYYSFSIAPRADLTYGEFEKAMDEVCSIVGRGSDYEKSAYENRSEVAETYEDALKDYEDFKTKDRVTGAYMRLFCDYSAVILVVLPIFLGVTRCLRDKRAKAAEVLYSKSISSGMLIASRYAAAVVMAFAPVLVIAFVVQMPIQYAAVQVGVQPDVFAFFKYTCLWLLPEIMIVLAAAFLITELCQNILSIFVQVFWGLGSIMSMGTLTGDFGLKLVTRWNSTGEAARFMEQLPDLLLNKGYYSLLSMICLAVTVWIYEKKRREGVTVIGKVFQSRR